MATAAIELKTPKVEVTSRKVLIEGGKGGIGKTDFARSLTEYYQKLGVHVSLVDMDTENKTRGSLSHFFPQAFKSNIHRNRGLDDLIMDEAEAIVLADMGAGAGEVTQQWFDSMYQAASENGVAFTAIGIVTPDTSTITSVLSWAKFLQNRVDYIVVLNSITNPADFSYWENDPEVAEFRRVCRPRVIKMEFRLPEIQNETREHGITMQAVANRKTDNAFLSKSANVWRAQAYQRNIFAELDRVKDLLLL